MRTFYTGTDIEDLAASGVRQLEVGPGVALTDAARERAEELGVALIVPGSKPAAASPSTAARAGVATGNALPARPRGCQHGPLATAPAQATGKPAGTGAVVEQLVETVSALKKRGG